MKKIISLLLAAILITNYFGASLTVQAIESEDYTNSTNVASMLSNYVNQADYFDENIYTADYIVSDSVMKEIEFYMNSETSSEYMVDYLKGRPLFNASYATWEGGKFITDPVGTTNSLLDKTPYYEALILKLIDSTYEEKSFVDLINRKSIQKALKFRKKFEKAADSILSTKYLLENKEFVDLGIYDKEAVQSYAKSFVQDNYYHIGDDLCNILEEVISGLDTFDNLYKTVGTYATICEVKESTIDFLKMMKSNTDNIYLKYAIDDIVVMHDNSFFGLLRNGTSNILKSIIKSGFTYLVNEWKNTRLIGLIDGTLSDYLKVNPLLIATQLTVSIGNMAFSIDKKLDKYEIMKALCNIEKTAENTFRQQVNNYSQVRGNSNNFGDDISKLETGEILVTGVKFIFNCYIVDSQLYQELINICRTDWISTIDDEQFESKLAAEEQQQQIYKATINSIIPKSGSCGDHAFWYLGKTGVLFIVGYGETKNFEQNKIPWYEYKDAITSVSVHSAITKISDFAFADCNIKKDIIFTGDITCGNFAFLGLDSSLRIMSTQALTLISNHSLKNDIYVVKNFITSGKLSLFANCYSDNDVTLNGEVDVQGNINAENNVDLKGKVYLKGIVNAGNKFDYSGNIYAYNNINIAGNLEFTGNTESSFVLYSGATLSAKSANLNPTPFFGSGISYFTINNGAKVVIDNDFVMNDRTLKGSNWMTHYVKVRVRGDLLINGDYMPNGGTLVQDDSQSNVTVCGDWLWYEENTSYSRSEELTSGTLKIYGNICESIKSSGSHTLILCGNNEQKIYRGFEIANLKNLNTSTEGIDILEKSIINGNVFSPDCKVTNGKNLFLKGRFDDDTYNGDITLVNASVVDHDLVINGNLFCFDNSQGNVHVSNSCLTVQGNLTIESIGFYGSGNSYLRIDSNSTVKVKGNTNIKGNGFSFSNWMFHHSNCIIDGDLEVDGDFNVGNFGHVNLNNEGACLRVKGNYDGVESEAITTGNIEIGGNVFNLKTADNSKLILVGKMKQTVNCSDFSTIVSQNKLGIIFNKNINVATLFNHNGYPFTLYNDGKNSTFVDFDGDGLTDNIDSEPIVGNPCTLYFAPNDEDFGTVSDSIIETCGGTTVSVTATPTTKYNFVKWIDENNKTVSTNIKWVFVAKSNKKYTAVFEKRKRNISSDCIGGTIDAPLSAVIDSEVKVSVNPYEGYIFEEDSLKYNNNQVNSDFTFIMPDEDVVISALFVRNENYFLLKEKIDDAKTYNRNDFTISSFDELGNAINVAETFLVNDISEKDSTKSIELLEQAISRLVEKSVVSVSQTNDIEIFWNCSDMLNNEILKVEYDNDTENEITVSDCIVSGFDCNEFGKQTINAEYSNVDFELSVVVSKRPINYCDYSSVEPQIYIKDGKEISPEVILQFNGEKLIKDKDYVVKYENNTAIGTAQYTITGIGNYSGEIKDSFEIYCKHNYVTNVITEASCTSTGLEEAVCSTCGEHKDYNGSSTNVIPKLPHKFNDWVTDEEAIGHSGEEHRKCELCEYVEKREINKLYFVLPADWNNAYCYCWIDNTNIAGQSWPGNLMQDTGWEYNGYSVYSCTCDADMLYDMVIFNSGSGGIQTADLVAQFNKCYDYVSNSWYNITVDYDTSTVELEEIMGENSEYCLYGDFNNWTDGMTMTTIDGQNVKSIVKLKKGTYSFSIKNSTHSVGSSYVINNETSGMGYVLSSDYDKFTINALGGKYVFNYNTSNKRLTVSYTYINPEEESNIQNLIGKVFSPDPDDSNVSGFGFSNDILYSGLNILGVQKKSDGTDSVRFVSIVSSDILSNESVLDYGYVFTTTTKDTLEAKQNAGKLTIDNGHKYSCKDTINTMTGNYGNTDWTSTPYKYVTAAINNINNDKAVVARFYIETESGTYYATYTDGMGDSYDGCVVRWSEIQNY